MVYYEDSMQAELTSPDSLVGALYSYKSKRPRTKDNTPRKEVIVVSSGTDESDRVDEGEESEGDDRAELASQSEDVQQQISSSTGLQPFTIKPSDEYRKPVKGDFIWYLYHEDPEKEYRVGKLCSGDGELRFYNEGESPSYFKEKFYLNKQLFREGRFRVRTDLAVGR